MTGRSHPATAWCRSHRIRDNQTFSANRHTAPTGFLAIFKRGKNLANSAHILQELRVYPAPLHIWPPHVGYRIGAFPIYY
jgi:hypothetical protein